MKRLFTFILALTAIYSVVITTACPKKDKLRKAAETSYEMVGVTRDAIKLTGRAYSEKLISLKTKNEMADRLSNTLDGIEIFNNAVRNLVELNKEGKLDSSKLDVLSTMFSDKVVGPFTKVLESAKVISPERAKYLRIIIGNIRNLVLTVAEVLKVKTGDLQSSYREEKLSWAI